MMPARKKSNGILVSYPYSSIGLLAVSQTGITLPIVPKEGPIMMGLRPGVVAVFDVPLV